MPVKPIESFGASSQRALEDFRLNYNTNLASQPATWSQDVGDLLPGDSLKDTYPIAISAIKYRELANQSAEAVSRLAKDITVIKREFGAAAEVELRRLKRGDFAYVKKWAENAGEMARARQFLRNHLAADLILTGENSGTCALDGLAFFSASHPINPFDAGITDKDGNATFSNFVAGATPLNSANLTAQKTAFAMTPGPDGEELGLEADIVIVPTSLNETAFNLLSVQDLLLSGELDGAGGGTMGTVRNPHYQRGLKQIRAPELPGTDATADWYLASSTALMMGLYPFVIAEDTTEELREWGEDSDYYKDTSRIKIEGRVLAEAAFLFPHGLRKISGS